MLHDFARLDDGVASRPANSGPSPRLASIDLIKALAIVSVICLHSLSQKALQETAAVFYIWQAVPVFVVLLGLNGAASLQRRGGHTLRELYSRTYLASRFDRIYTPFLIAFAGSLLVASIAQGTHHSPYSLARELVSGELPLNGPGIYFITLLFQAVLLVPLVYWGLRRWPARTLLLCLAMTVGYEVLALRTDLTSAHPFLGEAFIARYLLLLALGCAIAAIPVERLLRSRWLWCGALLSSAYLLLIYADPQAIAVGRLSASVFYPTLLVIVGIAGLHRVKGPLLHGGVELGRASYHIFLAQIVWFALGVWSIDSVPALLGNLAVTIAAGIAFYELMSRAPLPSAAWLLAQRKAVLDAATSGGPQNVGA
jgi:peptidoglycan/LPS O-acetylase OafA/YrhL